ncbi:unnamed protein product [Arabis nemorensis]|uniref:Uncharacterized protein n=1 Tax=Arabis nemorensis TaxID=586526 RepID=A0A565C7U5_9BRAS|nr:unnamed protein product [Arabis nemorensis]
MQPPPVNSEANSPHHGATPHNHHHAHLIDPATGNNFFPPANQQVPTYFSPAGTQHNLLLPAVLKENPFKDYVLSHFFSPKLNALTNLFDPVTHKDPLFNLFFSDPSLPNLNPTAGNPSNYRLILT